MTTPTRRLRQAMTVTAAALVAACAGGSEAADTAPTTRQTAAEATTDDATDATTEDRGATTTDQPASTERRSTTTESRPTTTESRPTTTASTSTTSTTTSTTTTLPPTTTTTPEPARMPLTGIPLDYGQAPPDRPAMVVKVDNAPAARPQSGFNLADIVFEEIVNDNLTRFALVFHSQGSDPVGPIRSGRLQDVDLFASYAAPSFVWSGGNATVENAIANSGFLDLRFGSNGLFLDRGKRSPHQVYGNTSTLWENTQPWQGRPGAQFSYRRDGEQPLGVPAAGVDIILDSVDVRWIWDPALGGYLREMDGEAHYDAATGQVSTHNVVVLAMNYVQGVSDSPDAQSIGYGEAHVFSGGTYVHGTWVRADRFAPFTLAADDGTPIELTPGRTFIELPRPASTFSF